MVSARECWFISHWTAEVKDSLLKRGGILWILSCFSRRRGNIRSYLSSNLLFEPFIHVLRRIRLLTVLVSYRCDQVFFLLYSIFNKPIPQRRTFRPRHFWGRTSILYNLTSDYSLAHVSRLNISSLSVHVYICCLNCLVSWLDVCNQVF